MTPSPDRMKFGRHRFDCISASFRIPQGCSQACRHQCNNNMFESCSLTSKQRQTLNRLQQNELYRKPVAQPTVTRAQPNDSRYPFGSPARMMLTNLWQAGTVPSCAPARHPHGLVLWLHCRRSAAGITAGVILHEYGRRDARALCVIAKLHVNC